MSHSTPKNNLMVPYQRFTFEEFYEIVKSLPHLNEDVGRIIYYYLTPKYTKNDRCILKDTYSTYTQKVSIIDVYFSNVILAYCYSYETRFGFGKYADENLLYIDESKDS